jgi:hypothetical protein
LFIISFTYFTKALHEPSQPLRQLSSKSAFLFSFAVSSALSLAVCRLAVSVFAVFGVYGKQPENYTLFSESFEYAGSNL